MPSESLVDQILEDLLSSHRTPEEACGGDPELLREVRARWEQIQLVGNRIDVLFAPDDLTKRETTIPSNDIVNMPVIEGYEVTEILGRGGMGIVFKARHLKLNRFVAMKMLLGGNHAGTPEIARFRREAEAVAALRHPNIVQVHDVGEVSSGPYFTMEFVEGGTLARALNGKTLPPREAANLVATLACGVQFAHKSGFIHRDLKPGNVLLTEDGTPKITDFGLVRSIDGPAFTLPGARVGTPSYMAPEQALGKTSAIGPAVDIYALGAVLYESLTGHPPFEGNSVAETERKLIHDEPMPPSRHNPKVPRDLETICLKCLHKDPARRYASAQDLADDLHRFLDGDAISARPEGRIRRAVRAVRRRPTLAVAVGAGVIVVALTLAAGFWQLFDRVVTEREVTTGLDKVEELLQKSSFAEAKASIERAQGRLGTREAPALRQRLNQLSRECQLADRLEQIYLNSVITVNGLIRFNEADRDFDEAFREFGVGQYGDDPEIVAAQVRKSNIRTTILAALDRWSVVAVTRERVDWTVEVADRAEPNPTPWRRDARNRKLRRNPKDLVALTARADVEQESVALLLALSSLLVPVSERRADVIGFQLIKRTHTHENEFQASFLTKVQRAHPDDLWANFYLGAALMNAGKPDEAIRYFQAVIALRPRLLIGYHHLGKVLRISADSGSPERFEEAIMQLRKGLEIDPNSIDTHLNLIDALARTKRHDEAITQARTALKLKKSVPLVRAYLGSLLHIKGQVEESLQEFREANSGKPDNPQILDGYRQVLRTARLWNELRPVWGKELEIGDRPKHDHWYGYAELCLYLGQEDEYRPARQALLARFGTTESPQVAERTARACLLLPASEDEMGKILSLADLAAKADPKKYAAVYPYFQFVKGFAEYRQGNFDRAIAVMRGDASKMPGPAPLLVLSMALHRTGKEAEARKTLASAMLNHSWAEHRVRNEDGWIRHVLRREAERLIVPNLTALLEGKQKPRDKYERVAQIGVLQFENRYAALSRVYAETFAAGLKYTTHMHDAAGAAVQAGCGRGADAGDLSEAERAKLRAQARTWLREVLAEMIVVTNRDFSKVHGIVHQELTKWQTELDLVGIREPAELAKLLPEEQADCRKLWAEIKAIVDLTAKPK